MNNGSDLRKLLPQYLLGELSPEQVAAIDEKYLFDESFADAIEDARRDLLDSLAAGELSSEDRVRVEKAFGQIPPGVGALTVARALHARQEKERLAEPVVRRGIRGRPWIWAAAAAVLLALTATTFVWHRSKSSISPLSEAVRTVPEPSGVTETPQEPARDETAFVVLLSPEISRGTYSSPSFAVPAYARFVEFQIVVMEDKVKARYEVQLTSNERPEPLTFAGLEPRSLGAQRYLEFRTPVGSLPAGKYVVRVSAEPPVGARLASYEIRIAHSPAR